MKLTAKIDVPDGATTGDVHSAVEMLRGLGSATFDLATSTITFEFSADEPSPLGDVFERAGVAAYDEAIASGADAPDAARAAIRGAVAAMELWDEVTTTLHSYGWHEGRLDGEALSAPA